MVSTTVFEAVRLGSSPSTSASFAVKAVRMHAGCREDSLKIATCGFDSRYEFSFTEGYVTWDVTSALKAERARKGQEFDSAIPPPVLWKFI